MLTRGCAIVCERPLFDSTVEQGPCLTGRSRLSISRCINSRTMNATCRVQGSLLPRTRCLPSTWIVAKEPRAPQQQKKTLAETQPHHPARSSQRPHARSSVQRSPGIHLSARLRKRLESYIFLANLRQHMAHTVRWQPSHRSTACCSTQ